MGIKVENGPPDKRRGGRAKDDRHHDDGLEGRGPANALSEHRDHKANEGDEEWEDQDPDDVVLERGQNRVS